MILTRNIHLFQIFGVRSEKGYEKSYILVRNRVKVLRTVRHTPTQTFRETLVVQRCQTPFPQGVSPNVRITLTISWSECVHGFMSVFKTQFRRVRGEYILSMRDAEPRCEWCVNTCSSGLCNLHESDADGTESPSAARASLFDIESVSITFSSFCSSSGLVCL